MDDFAGFGVPSDHHGFGVDLGPTPLRRGLDLPTRPGTCPTVETCLTVRLTVQSPTTPKTRPPTLPTFFGDFAVRHNRLGFRLAVHYMISDPTYANTDVTTRTNQAIPTEPNPDQTNASKICEKSIVDPFLCLLYSGGPSPFDPRIRRSPLDVDRQLSYVQTDNHKSTTSSSSSDRFPGLKSGHSVNSANRFNNASTRPRAQSLFPSIVKNSATQQP